MNARERERSMNGGFWRYSSAPALRGPAFLSSSLLVMYQVLLATR